MRYGILAIALLLAACGGKDARERIVIYSPHGKEMLSESEQGFEQLHPEVDVQWIDMGGQDAYDRIRTEKENPQASIWWGGAAQTFARAANEGLLDPYTPTWSESVPPEAHDSNDYWYGTFLTPEVIAYNDRVVSEAQAPGDWDDLLDPVWRGRLLIRYPLASSTMRTIFGAMILRQPTVEEGYAWLARLDRNVKTYTADPTQLYLRLARQEGDVTLWNMPDIELQSERNGYPFGYRIPAAGTPVLVDGIALVKGGPNIDRAKQFYEFVTSDSAQIHQATAFYRIPVRKDIDSTKLPTWISKARIKPMALDWDRLEQEGPTWMQYWDEQIKGRGENYLRERGLE
ncbi:MAG TPA: extracellular solute-binding protein [Rhodothermales bacterium]|nr:extracellular solute-binding protein [Rhodothermales bacterium]